MHRSQGGKAQNVLHILKVCCFAKDFLKADLIVIFSKMKLLMVDICTCVMYI